MKQACTTCSKSAAGPDGFEPAEMALLPLTAYQWMAKLLNKVEEGTDRPRGMQEGRAEKVRGEYLPLQAAELSGAEKEERMEKGRE